VVAAVATQTCARPQPVIAFAADSMGGSPLRLVVWNQVDVPVNLEVTVGGAPLFSGVAKVSQMYPKIVIRKELYLKKGIYRVIVRDRTRGLERSVVLNLRAVANINIMLNPGELLLGTDALRDPMYL
jgi:hypothetical protein